MSTMFDRTLTIQAPLHLVWQEAYKFARRGKIVIERLDQLLVATQLKFGYVYWLQENPDGSTNLRVAIGQADQVEEKLNTTSNVPAALAALATQEQSTGSELMSAALGVFFQAGSPEFNAETALKESKKKAEREAKKAHWAPRPVLGSEPAAQSEVMTIAQEIAQPTPVAVAPGKPPFHPGALVAMAVIFNFGVAGVLAGLNWKRLGKPERMWPTILVSLAGMFAFEAMILSWPVDDSLFYAICAALGALFAFWQGSYYSRWVATYGKAKTGVRGFLTMLGIGLGIQLVDYLAHVVMSFLQAIFTTGF